MRAGGPDRLDERIKFSETRIEELFNGKARVAARMDDQTTHEPALRVEVGRNES